MNHRKTKLLCMIVLGALVLSACASRTSPADRKLDIGLDGGISISALPTAPKLEVNASVPVKLMPLKPLNLAQSVTQVATGSLSDIDLTIPTVLTITKPKEKLTTTYQNYFITGTSDPSSPVYFGNTEIERQGSSGTFGVYVPLVMGNNSFTFSQNGETKTVTIVRKAEAKGEAPIKDIKQSSMYPAVSAGVKVGEDLEVGCVAPAGATVTATFGGNTATLKQTVATTVQGIPTLFKGSIPVESAAGSDVTQKAGTVSYTMSTNEGTKQYKSTGNVYVAGENSDIAVKVSSYIAFLYPDTKNVSVFREKLKAGATDYIKSQDNTYYELASGGFLPKDMVEVVEGNVAVSNKLSKVTASANNKGESYTFAGTRLPAYYTKLSDGVFSFTLYNTSGSADANVASSKLFSGAAATDNGSSVTYKFTFSNAAKLWGYNVSFDGKNTVLSFKYKPTLAPSSSRPFEGLNILLDPGHGGTDPGALGVAGTTGPNESKLNLAHAYATRDLLTEMGANVMMARSEDVYISLDDRLKMIEEVNADLFISLHHNSLGENVDANKVKGMELYYHDPLSKSFADSMMAGLAVDLNRNNRGVIQSYYRVTLMPYAPSILVELGFLCNPKEYENAADRGQIDKVAKAIASGVKKGLA